MLDLGKTQKKKKKAQIATICGVRNTTAGVCGFLKSSCDSSVVAVTTPTSTSSSSSSSSSLEYDSSGRSVVSSSTVGSARNSRLLDPNGMCVRFLYLESSNSSSSSSSSSESLSVSESESEKYSSSSSSSSKATAALAALSQQQQC